MDYVLLKWLAAGTAALTFGGFAWAFLDAFNDGAGRYSESMGREASREFEDLFLFIPPEKIVRLGRIGALGAFFLFFIPLFSFTNMLSTLAGVVLGAAAGMSAFTVPGKIVRMMREKRRIKFNNQLVDSLGSMSNALRAGFSLNQAFESVAENGEPPISQEFKVVLQQMRIGMTFEEALANMDARIGSDDLTLVITAMDIARKTGGNLTEIFDRISETIRGRMRIERRVRTLTAQGRLQGLVVSAMPVLLGVAMTILKPEVMIPFLTSLSGLVAVAVAIGLVSLGWVVIRKIVKIDV